MDANDSNVHLRHVRARLLAPEVAITTFDEVQATYTPDEAMAEARRALSAGFDLEAAKQGCPFKVDIPAYLQKIAKGDFDSALAIIRQSHPFPSVFGRMCHLFCLQATPPLEEIGRPWAEWDPKRRSRFITPVYPSYFINIRGVGAGSGIPDGHGVERPAFLLLERFVGDYGDPDLAPVAPERPPSGKRVAVIGAGSGGLAAAWMLRRLGHDVDIYDSLPVPGGALVTGYPPQRMTAFAVRRESDPTAWGARFFGDRRLTKEALQSIIDAYDLTFLSSGEAFPVPLGIDGEDAQGVWVPREFIARATYGQRPAHGGRCIIIGAGSTAADVAQVARRLGCEVTIFYRRGFAEMRLDGADPRAVVATMSLDGIEYRPYAQPVRIHTDHANRVTGVEFIRTRPGEPEDDGRPGVQPLAGSNFVEPCDLVVLATGEAVDLGAIPESIAQADGVVLVDRADHRTTHPKVFAAGDVIGDKGNDGAALGGIQAAYTMDSELRGEPPKLFDSRPLR